VAAALNVDGTLHTGRQRRRVAAVVQRRLVAMATDSVQPSDGFTGSRPLPLLLLLLLLLSSWVRREIVLVLQLSAGNSARVTSTCG